MGYTLLPVGICFHIGAGMYEVAEHHPFSYDRTGEYDAASRTLRIRRDRGLFPREVLISPRIAGTAAGPRSRSTASGWSSAAKILWHREIEVWHAARGEAVRIDEGFEPPPYDPPDWVKAVQNREGV